VTRNYWWPGVTRDVGKYVEGCDSCQRMKNRTEEPAGKLKLSEVPQKTWTHLTVDFITKLLVVAGKDVILVVCDRLSKNDPFCGNDGRNIGGRVSKVVPEQCMEITWVAGKCSIR